MTASPSSSWGRAPSESSGPEARFLYRALDAVIERFGSARHDAELGRARTEFEERRGRIFEDEPLWEDWTQAFLEWFAIERPWDGGAVPAARLRAETEGRTRTALAAWLTSQRVLAEVLSLGDGRVVVADLIGGAEFAVSEERALHGVQPGDLVEVRLIGFEEVVRFGRTFVYHPRVARQAVAEQCRVLMERGAGAAGVLDALAALRVRVERYRHVSAARVYEVGAEASLRPAVAERGES